MNNGEHRDLWLFSSLTESGGKEIKNGGIYSLGILGWVYLIFKGLANTSPIYGPSRLL